MTSTIKKKGFPSFFQFQKNHERKHSVDTFCNDSTENKVQSSDGNCSAQKSPVRSQPSSPSMTHKLRNTKGPDIATPERLLSIAYVFKIAVRSRNRNSSVDSGGRSPSEEINNEKKSKWEKMSKKKSGSRESIDSLDNHNNQLVKNDRSYSVGSIGSLKRRLGVGAIQYRSASLSLDFYKGNLFGEEKSSNILDSNSINNR